MHDVVLVRPRANPSRDLPYEEGLSVRLLIETAYRIRAEAECAISSVPVRFFAMFVYTY